MDTLSLNAAAEAKQLPAWSSWKNGNAPAGYFEPNDPAMPAFFEDQGFCVIQNAISMEEVEALRAETAAICRGERGEVGGIPENFPGETDDEIQRRVLCIHFPHKISELMLKYLGTPNMASTLTGVIGPNVKCMQSMLFIKSAGKPGQAWHQDEIYIPTRDRSLTGGWIALDDATVENGCLWVLPGSHKSGVLYDLKSTDDRRFDCSGEAFRFPWTNDDAIPVEVKAGSIVFFNGYLLHRSLPNYASAGYRRVLVNHYMSAESFLPWYGDLPAGKHAAIADHRDIVMIAGEDPYGFRGVEDVHRPHVRPSGEGGCGKGS